MKAKIYSDTMIYNNPSDSSDFNIAKLPYIDTVIDTEPNWYKVSDGWVKSTDCSIICEDDVDKTPSPFKSILEQYKVDKTVLKIFVINGFQVRGIIQDIDYDNKCLIIINNSSKDADIIMFSAISTITISRQ